MNYPKPVMSIRELSALGYPVEYLRQLSRAKGSPCFRASNSTNAKVYFYTDKLDNYIADMEERKSAYDARHRKRL